MTDVSLGISTEEAIRRLAHDGPNELPGSGGRGLGHLAWEAIREPMFLLLLGCGALYWLLGDWQESFILLGFVFFIAALTIAQDWKTERALSALRDLSSPRAVVIRDGQQRRIAGRDVVVGDHIILNEGDRVPADVRLISASHLSVDESLLTGESVPVPKYPEPGFDRIFASTLVVRGQGVAETVAVGRRTRVGNIGTALASIQSQGTPLQMETRNWVRRLAWGAGILCAAVVVIYGITRSDWLGGLLAGLTLAMAILPNEFPMVVVIFLSLGAWRLSKKKVLTRRISAVETLGATTVLCVDKTGTLTQNHMSLRALSTEHHTHPFIEGEPVPSTFGELLESGLLAGQPNPIDPMEQAIVVAWGKERQRPLVQWRRIHEYPLSRGLQAMSNLWISPDEKKAFASAKGAPEAIFDLCHLAEPEQRRWEQRTAELSTKGLRVLGVAVATPPAEVRPKNQHDFDFRFLGLLGFGDPVRPGVAQAVADARRAGIRVVMITGDHPGTAVSVARSIGLDESSPALTGPELERLSDEELRKIISHTTVFARVIPEQKLRLVQALKKNGEIVVMTGDGVNDAPALKAAHIGIAMGERGTDVAREAADLVLLDDDFASLVAGVRMGRRVFDNLKKGLAYILAIHIPIAGMTIIPVAMKWPLILLPIHIAFLHLIIDPAGSVVFEAEGEEGDIMSRPPRRPTDPLFGRALWGTALWQGIVVMGMVLSLFALALRRGHSPEDARALTFASLIVANLGLIFVNRSRRRSCSDILSRKNAALWLVAAGSMAFLALVLSVDGLRNLFRFSALHSDDVALCLLSGGAVTVLLLIAQPGSKEQKRPRQKL